jgi:hypothetical protein
MSTRVFAILCGLVLAACTTTQINPQGNTITVSNSEWPDPPNPLAAERIQTRIDNIKYQHNQTLLTNLERLVAYGDVAVPFALEGLKSDDAMTRMGCAYVLGRIGNPRVIPDLRPLLEDEVAIVRFEVASRLGDLGSREGYAVLVDGLEDPNIRNRYNCFKALSEQTGRDFGYKHNDQPEQRAVAVAQWRAWLNQIESEQL